MEIPTLETCQPEPLMTIHEGTIFTSEEMTYFGEDVVVSLGKYFWSRKDKAVVKNGYKRTRESTFNQGVVQNQIIWKRDSFDTKQESLDTEAAMGAFDGANFNSVSQLNKELEEKEQELQKSKKYLVQVEACHSQEIQWLKNEYD